MNYLSVVDVEHVAYELAKAHLTWKEPIPDFSTRFPGILEQCLSAPRQTFDKKPLYHGLIGKASIFFYLMIKNHPFQNGNKRIAVMTLLLFLYENEKWLRLDSHQLYRFAKWVAESDARLKDAVVQAIELFLKQHLIARP